MNDCYQVNLVGKKVPNISLAMCSDSFQTLIDLASEYSLPDEAFSGIHNPEVPPSEPLFPEGPVPIHGTVNCTVNGVLTTVMFCFFFVQIFWKHKHLVPRNLPLPSADQRDLIGARECPRMVAANPHP